MQFSYDLHLHSCLSPCGDADMTPNNIVNLAALLELDVIALTDHNTCSNCAATVATAKNSGLVVVPGMELTTAEEIHVVCLFPDCDAAEAFSKTVRDRSPFYENREDIFGEQLILDENDEVVGKENRMLLTASEISLMQVPDLVLAHGGVCFPAHIEKDSYSLLSILGGWPPECGFSVAELKNKAKKEEIYARFNIPPQVFAVSNSDAHFLESMGSAAQKINLSECSVAAVLEALRSGVKE